MKIYKKIITMALTVFLMVSMLGFSALAESENEVDFEGEEILYKTDFEDWKDSDLSPLYNTVPETNNFLVWCNKMAIGKDGGVGLSPTYGSAGVMAQPMRPLEFIPMPVPTSGIYHFRFDFRAGTSETGSTSGIEFSRGNTVATIFGRSYMKKWGLDWYNIDVMLDYDSNTWSATATPYSENGEIAHAEGAVNRVPRGLSIVCTADDTSKRNINTVPIIDNFCFSKVSIHKEPIMVKSITSKNIGNIFDLDDDIVLNIDRFNRSSYKVEASSVVEAADSNGNVLWTHSVEETFNENESKIISVNPQNLNKYDIYTIKITTKTRYPDFPEFKTEEDTFISDFSRAWKVSKDKINDKYGTALLIYHYGWSAEDGVASGLAAEAGLCWNREEVQWREIEKEKGKYEIPERALNELKKAKEAGMKNHLGLIYGNPLYTGRNAFVPVTEEQLEAYGAWCKWLARETRGLVDAFGVWNEVNHPGFNPNNITPEQYVELMKVAYNAIKAPDGNPDAIIVGLETAGIDHIFNDNVFKAGAAKYMDVAAVHPYDWSGHFDTKAIINNCNKMKETMAKYGEVKPIWWTEFGFCSAYSDEDQANGIVMAYCLQECYDLAEVTYQFRMQDDLDMSMERERKWGFIRDYADSERPNAAKPSYLSVSAMNNLIGSMAEPKDVINEGTNYAFRFFNNDLQKDVAVIIGEFDSTYMSFDFGCDTVDIYDIYGNKLRTAASDNNVFSFAVGKTPVYAVGSFTEFKQVDNSLARVLPLNMSEIGVNGETVTFSFEKNTSTDLKIAAEENKFLKVEENTEFKNGKASVTLRVSEDLHEDTSVTLSLVDKYGNVHYTREHEVIFKPLDISVSAEPASGDLHWRAVVNIKNNSKVNTIDGTVTALSPEKEADYILPREFNGLKPGENTVLYLNLPQKVIKNTIDLELEIALTNGYTETVIQKLDFSSAQYASKKPVIDGVCNVGEWMGNWFGAEDKVHFGSDDYSGNKEWNGPEDCSFSGITMWDEDYLYVLVDAVDDIHYNNAKPGGAVNMWRTDSVQFGIDDRDQSALNPVGTDKFTEIGIADVPGEGAKAWRYTAFYDLPTGDYVNNCELSVVRHDKHTIYECRFPWTELLGKQFKAEAGKVVNFSIVLNDSDIGSRGWIMYNGGIVPDKNIKLFGSLTLKADSMIK